MVAVVDCPTCSAKVEWREENAYRPFCSARCKHIDLGAWAEEKYKIPGASPEEEQDLEGPPH
ncbi:MAG: DNA gyrase inhibitor YacG [Betaproteobacteria bacterium]